MARNKRKRKAAKAGLESAGGSTDGAPQQPVPSSTQQSSKSSKAAAKGGSMYSCFACGQLLPSMNFSKSQLRKDEMRRCRTCITNEKNQVKKRKILRENAELANSGVGDGEVQALHRDDAPPASSAGGVVHRFSESQWEVYWMEEHEEKRRVLETLEGEDIESTLDDANKIPRRDEWYRKLQQQQAGYREQVARNKAARAANQATKSAAGASGGGSSSRGDDTFFVDSQGDLGEATSRMSEPSSSEVGQDDSDESMGGASEGVTEAEGEKNAVIASASSKDSSKSTETHADVTSGERTIEPSSDSRSETAPDKGVENNERERADVEMEDMSSNQDEKSPSVENDKSSQGQSAHDISAGSEALVPVGNETNAPQPSSSSQAQSSSRVPKSLQPTSPPSPRNPVNNARLRNQVVPYVVLRTPVKLRHRKPLLDHRKALMDNPEIEWHPFADFARHLVRKASRASQSDYGIIPSAAPTSAHSADSKCGGEEKHDSPAASNAGNGETRRRVDNTDSAMQMDGGEEKSDIPGEKPASAGSNGTIPQAGTAPDVSAGANIPPEGVFVQGKNSVASNEAPGAPAERAPSQGAAAESADDAPVKSGKMEVVECDDEGDQPMQSAHVAEASVDAVGTGSDSDSEGDNPALSFDIDMEAIATLRHAANDYVFGMLQQASMYAKHRGSDSILSRDLKLAAHVRALHAEMIASATHRA